MPIKDFIPPVITKQVSLFRLRNRAKPNADKQDLDLYWDEGYAEDLESWGKDDVWHEIQLLLAGCSGKVLDIACGTGPTIGVLKKFDQIEVHGFDISEMLINRAIKKGIPENRLRVLDGTKTNYADGEFDYSYSIGSLEHFTEEGIAQFMKECARYTKKASFHLIPIVRGAKNEGWIKTTQSYNNNTLDWWLPKFKSEFKEVIPVLSKWEDVISHGYWFICYK